MDEEKKETRAKEKPARQPKAPKEPKEPKRRAPDTGKDGEAGETMNDVFRKRLSYLMNGNNSLSRAVGIQELADSVGVSRPAIRKYIKH